MQIQTKQDVYNNEPSKKWLCEAVISNYDLTLFEKRQTE